MSIETKLSQSHRRFSCCGSGFWAFGALRFGRFLLSFLYLKGVPASLKGHCDQTVSFFVWIHAPCLMDSLIVK